MFSMTAIEGTLWSFGIKAQTILAKELFGSWIFQSAAVTAMAYFIVKFVKEYGNHKNSGELTDRVVSHIMLFAIGLSMLRVFSTEPFSPKDSSGNSWSGYSQVANNPRYADLYSNESGLYFYRLVHNGFNEISSLMTDIVSGVFRDSNYKKSPDMMFKMLANTASSQIDDPKISENLNFLATKCSDTDSAKTLDKNSTMENLFNMSVPDCAKAYQTLRADLKTWAKHNTPDYNRKLAETENSFFSPYMKMFTDSEAMENKLIASSLINTVNIHAAAAKDAINTNAKELGLKDQSSQFWFNLQRILSQGEYVSVLSSFFTDSNVSGAITRNEAGIIYNNLLNLIPAFKGYVRIFLALTFLLVGAGLAFGYVKPLFWWLSSLGMEMLYEPLSTLNYEVHSLLVSSSKIVDSYSNLKNDPLVLMGAAIIDKELVFYQTTFFLTQFVIAALFVVGIIGSGFAVNSMSFRDARGFASIINNRFVNKATSAIGAGAINLMRGKNR